MNYDHYTTLLIEKQSGIATVTLNIPDKLNTIGMSNLGMHKELEDIFVQLDADPEVNVVVVTGAGKAFSAGGDIRDFVELHGTDTGWDQVRSIAGVAKRLVENIINCTKPTVAAVNGDAIGLGATIALCCDISVMSETARIGDTHVKVGLVTGDGGALIWPLILGPNRAKDFLMRGLLVNGKKAEQMGLVNYCAPAEEVMERSMEIARDLNGLPPLAVRWTKVSVNKGLKEQFNLVMDAAIAYEMLCMVSRDHKEASAAFLEKRKPKFECR
ncbi:MAG: enoyl-CoA hydratase/isomerase family protein [Pigmentiphaga sp.]